MPFYIDYGLKEVDSHYIYHRKDDESGEYYRQIYLHFDRKKFKHFWNKLIQVGTPTMKDQIFMRNPDHISQRYLKNTLKILSHNSYSSLLMSNYNQMQRISHFIPDLARIIPKCQNWIQFRKFMFTQRDLQHIIHSSFN